MLKKKAKVVKIQLYKKKPFGATTIKPKKEKRHFHKYSKDVDFIDCDLCGGGRVRYCDCGEFVEV